MESHGATLASAHLFRPRIDAIQRKTISSPFSKLIILFKTKRKTQELIRTANHAKESNNNNDNRTEKQNEYNETGKTAQTNSTKKIKEKNLEVAKVRAALEYECQYFFFAFS